MVPAKKYRLFLFWVLSVRPLTQYDDNKLMTIKNLVEIMWLSRYLWPSEITNDRGYELLGHGFKNNYQKRIWYSR